MSDDSKLSDTSPLGRSVEDVEADGGNRVNPSVTTEQRREADHTVAPVPIANAGSQGIPGNFTSGSAPIIGVLGVGGHLRDDVNERSANTDADPTDNDGA